MRDELSAAADERADSIVPKLFHSSANDICTSGETGIRDRLRIYWDTPCRFKSCLVHHRKLGLAVAGPFFVVLAYVYGRLTLGYVFSAAKEKG